MQPALEIRNLTKSFGPATVVDDLSFAIAPGEIFGLLGPNGAGKSTTINMVAGVARSDAGDISVFGHDTRRDYRTTRRLIGVMHQEIVIDNFFTIERALRIHSGYYGVADDPRWRETLIERLGLGPHLKKPMMKLSGGLKRRFMVAKALIHRPPLLILDEPTAGVDVELRRTLWDFVREINAAGTTVLLTTHYLEEAEAMCGRIAIMNHGRLVALEPTTDLVARLGGRRIILRLHEPLEALPGSLAEYGAQLENGGTGISLSFAEGFDAAALLRELARHEIPVRDIETRRAGLEEVFLEITGVGGPAEEVKV